MRPVGLDWQCQGMTLLVTPVFVMPAPVTVMVIAAIFRHYQTAAGEERQQGQQEEDNEFGFHIQPFLGDLRRRFGSVSLICYIDNMPLNGGGRKFARKIIGWPGGKGMP